MNSFKGYITSIETHGKLSLVTVQLNPDIYLKSIVVDTPQDSPFLLTSNRAQVHFKETEVLIALHANAEISVENRIPGKIHSIEKGALLTRVEIKTEVGILVAIISTNTAIELQLQAEKDVVAMIKINEVLLSGI